MLFLVFLGERTTMKIRNSKLALAFSLSLGTGVLMAKTMPTTYGKMTDGHVDPQCLAQIQRDSEQVRATLEPARYMAIVKDPYHNARTDQEKIAALAAREIIYLVDRSGSMSGNDNDPTGNKRAGWTLWKSALEAGKSLLEVAVSLDANGKLDVVLWDYDLKGPRFVHQEVSTVAALESMFSSNTPFGYTPLAEALEYIYTNKLKGLLDRGEPFTVVVLTDGVPSNGFETAQQGQEKVYKFFKKLVSSHQLASEGRESLAAFSFIQAGDDEGATRFLTALDDNMKTGFVDASGTRQEGLGVDIIDYKKDNFIFGTEEYKGVQGVGPLGIFWGAMFD
jgi:hypothetical protein